MNHKRFQRFKFQRKGPPRATSGIVGNRKHHRRLTDSKPVSDICAPFQSGLACSPPRIRDTTFAGSATFLDGTNGARRLTSSSVPFRLAELQPKGQVNHLRFRDVACSPQCRLAVWTKPVSVVGRLPSRCSARRPCATAHQYCIRRVCRCPYALVREGLGVRPVSLLGPEQQGGRSHPHRYDEAADLDLVVRRCSEI
jgi:hypothetical protein